MAVKVYLLQLRSVARVVVTADSSAAPDQMKRFTFGLRQP